MLTLTHTFTKKIVLWANMSLLAINSLYEKRAMTGIYGLKLKRLTPCAERTIIFQRKNLDCLIACFTQCTLFFNTFVFYYQYVFCALSVENICNETLQQVTKERMCIKHHVLEKQNRTSRQSHCVATSKLHVQCGM